MNSPRLVPIMRTTWRGMRLKVERGEAAARAVRGCVDDGPLHNQRRAVARAVRARVDDGAATPATRLAPAPGEQRRPHAPATAQRASRAASHNNVAASGSRIEGLDRATTSVS